MNLKQIGDLSLRRRIVTVLYYLGDIQAGSSVLDAGSGDGLYSSLLAQRYFCHVYALEPDMDMSRKAQRNFEKAKMRGLISVANFKIEEMPQTTHWNEKFDFIVCSEVLEHTHSTAVALEHLFRVLKPGGVCAVTIPNCNYPLWWDPVSRVQEWVGMQPKSGIWNMHTRLYAPQDIFFLAENVGFVVERVDLLTHYCIPFSMQILRAGALIGSCIPIPGTDRHGDGPSKWNPLRWVEWVFERVDRLNDRAGIETSKCAATVNVALKLRKPQKW